MEPYFPLLILVIFLFIFVLVVRIPIILAKNRGVGGSNLTLISILSWLGIFFGITWVAALILAFLFEPGDSDETALPQVDAEELDKAYDLKQRGVISQAEFNRYKRKFLQK